MKLLMGLAAFMLLVCAPAFAAAPVAAVMFLQCEAPIAALVTFDNGGFDGVVFGPALSLEDLDEFQNNVLKTPLENRKVVRLPGDCGEVRL